MLRMMVITAHPGDEAGNFGGSLCLYHDRGVETCVLCLTPGQAATHRGGARSDQELALIRRQEFAASCEILKVSRGVVLDYPDGHLHRQDLYRVVCALVLHFGHSGLTSCSTSAQDEASPPPTIHPWRLCSPISRF